MKSVPKEPTATEPPAKQLDGFIAKFEPAAGMLIRQCRTEIRRLLPTAVQIVYDNFNCFVIGYCTSDRTLSCIISIAAGLKRATNRQAWPDQRQFWEILTHFEER